MIQAYAIGHDYEYAITATELIFYGGEPHVAIHTPTTFIGEDILIDARLGTPADFMLLLAYTDAFRRIGVNRVVAFIPYFPGARADRVHTGDGTSLTAAIYADIINNCGFHRVVIVDPHSDVTPALIHRCVTIQAADIIVSHLGIGIDYDAVVCPDQGAQKRTEAAAAALGISRIVHAAKHRDAATGRLSQTAVEDLGDLHRFLIVDDICDGGGTFSALAGQMRAQPGHDADTIDLYVTHGIFSRGPEPIPHINRVFTTDSFPGTESPHFERASLAPICGSTIKRQFAWRQGATAQ